MNKNNLCSNSENHSNLGLKELWLLWVGLLVFYSGIFLISVSLTGSLNLFLDLGHKEEGMMISCALTAYPNNNFFPSILRPAIEKNSFNTSTLR